MNFEKLGLAPELLRAVRDQGFEQPTPIQEQAIPIILSGRDLIGCAQTGTGKSAAFILPILHHLRGETPGKLRALILVPTRELAIQVGRDVRLLSSHLELRSTAVYGGVPIPPQEMMLRHGVDILVATPGRLKDHMWRGLIDFAETRFLVLDEADRMLDMGFIDAVREIVSEIPRERTSLLFSATLEPEIRRLARDILNNPVNVQVTPPATVADGIEHRIVRVPRGGKREALETLLREPEIARTIVFTRTRRGAHNLTRELLRTGHRASAIHSDRSQSQRLAALEAFREGRIDLLVATDIAARGIDVAGISHVINFDLPASADDYVHRTGRTARAGRKGTAISLVGPEDAVMLRSIRQRLGVAIEEEGEIVAESGRVPALGAVRSAGAGSYSGRGRSAGASRSTGARSVRGRGARRSLEEKYRTANVEGVRGEGRSRRSDDADLREPLSAARADRTSVRSGASAHSAARSAGRPTTHSATRERPGRARPAAQERPERARTSSARPSNARPADNRASDARSSNGRVGRRTREKGREQGQSPEREGWLVHLMGLIPRFPLSRS